MKNREYRRRMEKENRKEKNMNRKINIEKKPENLFEQILYYLVHEEEKLQMEKDALKQAGCSDAFINWFVKPHDQCGPESGQRRLLFCSLVGQTAKIETEFIVKQSTDGLHKVSCGALLTCIEYGGVEPIIFETYDCSTISLEDVYKCIDIYDGVCKMFDEQCDRQKLKRIVEENFSDIFRDNN